MNKKVWPEVEGVNRRIYELLYSLGITSNYAGFFQAALAVCLAAEQPERLRENLLSVRAFIARRLAKAVLGAVFIARNMTIRHIRHRAAPHVAGPLSPRGQLTPAPCIQL